jgi:GDP-L-fucose synthase
MGTDISITELAELVCQVVGFTGEIVHDTTKPNGAPRKLLDITRLQSMGWAARISLSDGISRTYDWFRKHGVGRVETLVNVGQP